MTAAAILKRHACNCPACRAVERRETDALLSAIFTDDEARAISAAVWADFGSHRVDAFLRDEEDENDGA